MSDPRARMVGETYKDYAARMYGWARAAEVDRDAALAELESLHGVQRAAEVLLLLIEENQRREARAAAALRVALPGWADVRRPAAR